ncbi:DUF7660 family protein [Streptomyces herbicida]
MTGRQFELGRVMNFWQEAHSVHDRQSLSAFLAAVSRDFQEDPERWENREISTFLEAMAAWVMDCDEIFRRNGESIPSNEAWATVAKVVAAARIYE